MTGPLQIDSVKLGSYSIAHNGPTGSLELSIEGTGRYLAFDGTGSYVAIPNQNLLSTWTAECWLYHEPGFASYETVIAGDVDEKYIMLLANGRPNLYYTGLIAPSMILPGWTHLASTCDGNRSKIYVNGVEVASKTAARTIKVTTLGARPERTGEWLKGGLRDVRLWSVARTAKQIEDNMNEQLTGNESGLVGLWMLDEGTGTTLQDLAQNNHGSTVNTCWEDGVNTPILSLQLDKNARFAKKIEAGTQTAAGDSDSVIATKKYVDDKAAAGGIQIGVGIVEPSGLTEGDWWYKEA